MTSSPPRVPIPKNGVDYRGKVVLAPMVRSGELPSRLLALKYGADLVWGPETIDRALIGTTRRENPITNTIDFTRLSSNGLKNPAHNPDQRESVIYRLHPVKEHKKLIFQIGTANPETAVQAAKLVAADVAGIDVNSGCPKPFSTSGGMGAALLRTPDRLCSILEALVKEVGEPHEIGISVKIRLLETPEKTGALVRRLVKTGITGLTVHCRTTPMRPRERAIREQLRMIADVCREAGVACIMNGDVENREQALQLMEEYGCDGAMIATAAERNSSVFRAKEDGGRAGWKELVREYMQFALEVENRWGNTKFLLSQMIPGKEASYMRMNQSKGYEQLIEALGFEDLRDLAKDVDDRLGLNNRLDKPTKRANAREENKRKQMEEAGDDSQTKKIKVPPTALDKPLDSVVVPDAVAEVAPGTALSV
ncbi:tRNA-dihydrouridine synthase 2 [Coniosporium tulheliwenetii]|uniref:tRNA-dihydrouridine synthase 2 n=1 Tax=Coniosporium tulheliwenetii TaxID=3383036 RepID=A0ACC2ZLS8_9PEZI|nr:tRNA-dihydrouridine synthase 2 [Cladosporium sp. JES 115]